jgi:competence protein ComEC
MRERVALRAVSGLVLGLAVALVPTVLAGSTDKGLDLYWIDVEGGGATLIVTPAGESVLIDTGSPGGRDAGRIHRVATEVAGLQRIDHVVVTHYHADHFGGLAELAALMPVGTLYENGIQTSPSAERSDPRLLPYAQAKVEKRVVVEPDGDIPLRGAEGQAPPRLRFLGARQSFVTPAKTAPNAETCRKSTSKEPDPSDNANSVVLLLTFGPFRFFDGGDLTWNLEGQLVCPSDRVGAVDVYQSDHHGLDQSNNPVLLQTLAPTLVVFNNGPRKGGEPASFAAASAVPSVKAIYELHRNVRDGAPNTEEEKIANRDEACAGSYITLSVEPQGRTFVVSVPSTGHRKSYATRVPDP